jgi:hypothetical protein
MTERYGYGYRDEPGGGERPSGRGAVAERRAGQEEEVREVDLTDEATDREEAIADAGEQPPPGDRETSGSFEPHPVAAAPAAAGTSIFDVGREEETAAPGSPEAGTDEGEPEVAEAEAEREAADGEAAAEAEREVAEAETDQAGREAAEREAAEAAADAAEPGAAEAQATEEPAAAQPATAAAAAAQPDALLASLDAEGARNRFLDIQAGFVDEPHQAVEEAGRFVDELVQRVTEALQGHRAQLQTPADDASTEDLRLALRSYRQFVDRLLGLAR